MKTYSLNLILNNGKAMPRVGLGTSGVKNLAEVSYQAVKTGYRHFDTAEWYKNEEELGKGLKRGIEENIVKREDLFVTTKLWPTSRNNPEKAIKASLGRLNLDYVDLYLIHWPVPAFEDGEFKLSSPLHEVWAEMENLVEKGLTRAIGVSNFNVQSLLDLLCYAKIRPAVNEVEAHPYFSNAAVAGLCAQYNIQLLAYNSFCKGEYTLQKYNLWEEQTVKDIALKHGRNEGEVILNWGLTKGFAIIPRTSTVSRLGDNLSVTSFCLDEEDMKAIDSLDKGLRTCNNYDLLGGIDFWA